MTDNRTDPDTKNRLGYAGWIAIVVLLGLLVWAGWYGVYTWGRLGGVAISPLGWLFMALGVVFTIAVGGGLMALVFYSSRNDYDR